MAPESEVDDERAQRLRGFDDRLLEGVRHDLRNPLTAIAGFAELLAADAGEETRLEAAHVILQAARQLEASIGDLLTAVALDAGAIEPEHERIEFVELAWEALQALAPEAEPGLLPAPPPSPGALAVVGDRVLLVDALTRACRHALASSDPPSSVGLALRHEPGRAHAELVYRESDASFEETARLLDSWRPARERRGLRVGGFGLLIARRLAELHGGSLALSGGPDPQTALLRLSLPLPS